MKKFQPILIFFLLFVVQAAVACAKSTSETQLSIVLQSPGDTLVHDSMLVQVIEDSLPQTDIQTEQDIQRQKVIAAVLAFPVPFGILGLHRIYLGTDPWVPVVYIITFGGGCGVLPLIDFLEIVFSSDQQMESFKHNKKIFMWVK